MKDLDAQIFCPTWSLKQKKNKHLTKYIMYFIRLPTILTTNIADITYNYTPNKKTHIQLIVM